ncbi:3-deoxy-7-phosphoheptulonate synthase [Anaeromyxobacter oryzae]|uniref:3-deoxy-7-phosphoheptulonate synthase n=2 Tax=Anaeromyxobacter oryzae TaxID=2918170 RepID=A0ABM7WW50_9BACT|nr:3-deoxy-7-phosphoheptulonate synthase [Anaeromyxobacter oryzae]BDG03732.1 3-deoxy-7-phosphoheptulonate synthase [Anaeromyxobacter oryzae]
MKRGCTDLEVAGVAARIEALGLRPSVSRGEERTVVGVIGDDRLADAGTLEALPGVSGCVRVLAPYKLASRDSHPSRTVVTIGEGEGAVRVGADAVAVIAGPCAVESWAQLEAVARAAKAAGARLLRGGAFKPRTSPYAFQGLGEEGLRLLARARGETGLPVVTEVMTAEMVPLVEEHADALQVGARNMQNFDLLRACGKARKPVLLKRGLSATLEELLMAAEYVLAGGNARVILCERGIRTYEKATRNTLDLSAVPALKELSHLPVMVDPSHGTGKRSLVTPMALAAVAAGADGLLVEVHPDPAHALSDGPQSLTPDGLVDLMARVRAVAAAVGRSA